jgi:hypothetical protein
VDTALAVVAAVLIVAALILLGIALMVAKSSSRARASKAAQDVAGSAAAASATASAAPQAGDLTEPLAFLLALFAKDPKFGHPALDEFVGKLRTPAGGKADEGVEQALNLIRNGDRTQLLVMLGGAALVGWLLAQSRLDAPPRE